MSRFPLPRRCLAAMAAVVSSMGVVTPALSAERLRFQFGELSRSVAVSSLVEFGRSGRLDADLQATLRHLKPDAQQALREALTQPVPVEATTVSTFLETDLGKSSLQQLVKVFAQPPSIAEPALSSALLLSAAKTNQLRFIDVLETYPTEELPINLAALFSLGQQLKRQFGFQHDLFIGLKSLQGARSEDLDIDGLAASGDIAFVEQPFAFVGREQRRIEAVAYLPSSASSDRPASLVVIAPGLNTDMNALLYVGKHLASHGYAVASLNFPFTSSTALRAVVQGTGAIPVPNTWYGQPLSVSDLIDQVRQRWGDRVNTDEVGALGQSLGGYTILALAGAGLDWGHLVKGCEPMQDPSKVVLNPAVVWQCVAPGRVVERRSFKDPRVKTVLAVNPVTNPIFSPQSMAAIDVPVMIIAGTNDVFAPPISQQVFPFSSLSQSGSRFVLQRQGTHLSFLDGTSNLPEFVIGPDQSLARQELNAFALGWFDQHLFKASSKVFGERGFDAGSAPLSIEVYPLFSRTQLHQAAPGLKEFQ